MPKKFIEMPPDDGTAASRRRIAFWQFSYGSGRTLSDIARAAGLPTANALYNFMNGATASLSAVTIERLIAGYPSADDRARLMPLLDWQQHVGIVRPVRLISEEQQISKALVLNIPIAAQAEALLLQQQPFLPITKQASLPLPRAVLPENCDGIFLTRIGAIGMEQAYPPGSLLLCCRTSQERALTDRAERTRLLVSQPLPGGCEVLICEIRRYGTVIWLWPLSDHPERQAPIKAPQTPSRSPRVDVVIHAVVLGGWVLAASSLPS